jgi:hypothetical protein
VRALIAFAVLAPGLFAAAPAAAQANADVSYQTALLARPLSAADQTYCAGKTSSQNDADACHVTRLFLVDAAAGQDKGFPPLADIKYAVNQAEISRIMDVMTKYGG